MSSFDMSTNMNPIIALNVAAISTDTTTAGVIIDTYGYEALTFVIVTGARSAGTITPLIEESTSSTFATSNAVADADLIGTEADAALAAANKTSKIGYVGTKRYVRLSLVSTGSASLTAGAIAINEVASVLPKSDQTP